MMMIMMMMMTVAVTVVIMSAADCGWNVTKALSSIHPAVAVAVPTAATTSQHCAVSSSATRVSSVTQHSAVTQVSQQQNDEVVDGDAAVTQPITEKLTEQGCRCYCVVLLRVDVAGSLLTGTEGHCSEGRPHRRHFTDR